MKWYKYLVLAVVILITTLGCMPRYCRTQRVPVTFVDGTITYWSITVCQPLF